MLISVENVISDKYPAFSKQPAPVRNSTISLLRSLLRESEINSFLTANSDASGFEFVERVLDYFDFSYTLSDQDRMNIPASGRVLIIANHPLGALDGLALLKLISEVRRDVKIIANDVLNHFSPLQSLFLPVDNLGKSTRKRDIARITQALRDEQAVIVFPAGEVSRAGVTGIKDGHWNSGFMRFARKTNTPILPVYIGGKNSSLFYGVSWLNRSISALLLAREMFNKQRYSLPVRIGEKIPFSQIDAVPLPDREKTKLLKKHLYRIARNRKPIFQTERAIAHPQSRQALKKELKESELLGETTDGKKIYLFDYQTNSAVIQEVGRLREIAFRCVGEGSGRKKDLDRYDRYYRHLILWDEEELEIAGAYRLAEAWKLHQQEDTPLYSASLFNYQASMEPYFSRGIELGRSFVQPKYWGKRSLDYLWYGIGAYLKNNPQVRYMFGPVSLSQSYPQHAQNLIVWFYRHYFGDNDHLAESFNRHILTQAEQQSIAVLFSGDNLKSDFKVLKEQLDYLGVSVPTLYKQYSDVCEEDGVRFLDFGVDPDFNYCIDGLVLVDMDYLKEKKRARYMPD